MHSWQGSSYRDNLTHGSYRLGQDSMAAAMGTTEAQRDAVMAASQGRKHQLVALILSGMFVRLCRL